MVASITHYVSDKQKPTGNIRYIKGLFGRKILQIEYEGYSFRHPFPDRRTKTTVWLNG